MCSSRNKVRPYSKVSISQNYVGLFSSACPGCRGIPPNPERHCSPFCHKRPVDPNGGAARLYVGAVVCL